MAASLEIHPAALEELSSAIHWYIARSEVAARQFAAAIEDAIASIQNSPQRWPAGEHGTRKYVLRRFPFALIYRTDVSSIIVLAVAHGNRRPGYWRTL
jgi:plasmid stabilization system protein ParE